MIANLGSDSDDDDDNKDSNPLLPLASMLKSLKGGGNDSGGDEVGVRKRTLARKLGDDFDQVVTENGLGKSKGSPVKNLSEGSEIVASRTRSWRIEESDGGDDVVKVVEDVKKTNSKGKKLKCVREKEKAKSVAESGSPTPISKTRPKTPSPLPIC
ncbi:hypothetical protein ACSBR1_007541 [Camellia fascicularis]